MRDAGVRVYTSGSGLQHPAGLIVDMFRDVAASRELAWRLAVRDIRAQYRQTALGLLWAFILPLAHTAIWLFLNGSGLVKVGETSIPYGIYVFSGTMLWAILTDAVNGPLQQATRAKSMLVKINFPREALLISGIYQTLFNGAIRIAMLLVVLAVAGINPGWNLLLFPMGVLSLVLAGSVIGLFLTPAGLLYQDVGKGMSLFMQFMMYLSPVVYAVPESGWAAALLKLNPLTPLLMTTRDWLTGVPAAYVEPFVYINLALLLGFMIFAVIFRLAMPVLIERMGS